MQEHTFCRIISVPSLLGISPSGCVNDARAGERTHVVPKPKQDLEAAAKIWFADLKDQRLFSELAGQAIVSF